MECLITIDSMSSQDDYQMLANSPEAIRGGKTNVSQLIFIPVNECLVTLEILNSNGKLYLYSIEDREGNSIYMG